MATTKGNNPVTGSATPSVSEAKAAETKARKVAAKAGQADANKLDKRVISAFKAAEKGVQNLSIIIEAAKVANIHKLTVDPKTGKAFGSFASYLAARSSEFPLMHSALRKPFVAEMVANGASVREVAAATQASVGTAQGDINEAKGLDRVARPGGATNTPAAQAGAKATKAAKALATAATRASDAVADMSDDELASVAKAAADLVSVAKATVKLRAQVVAKAAAAAKAAADKAVAPVRVPVPTPASAAKARAPIAVSA